MEPSVDGKDYKTLDYFITFFRKLRTIIGDKDDATKGLEPCVQEFKDFIESEASVFAACNLMIDETNELFAEFLQTDFWHFRNLPHIDSPCQRCILQSALGAHTLHSRDSVDPVWYHTGKLVSHSI